MRIKAHGSRGLIWGVGSWARAMGLDTEREITERKTWRCGMVDVDPILQGGKRTIEGFWSGE